MRNVLNRNIGVLGHRLTGEGILKDMSKVKAMLEMKSPTNVELIQTFCGMVNYYAGFMPRLADILRPIHALLKKGVKFLWTRECECAFGKIKSEIAK